MCRTKVQAEQDFHNPWVTFEASKGPPSFFLVCTLQSWVFNWFSSNSHQIFTDWTRSWTPVHFHHSLVIVVATRGPTLYFFFPLYRAEFSTNLLQIHTKYSLDQDLVSISFSSLISDFCDHQGGQHCFSCLCSTPLPFQWIIFKFTPNVHWAML